MQYLRDGALDNATQLAPDAGVEGGDVSEDPGDALAYLALGGSLEEERLDVEPVLPDKILEEAAAADTLVDSTLQADSELDGDNADPARSEVLAEK
jgi:hypothetical protein